MANDVFENLLADLLQLHTDMKLETCREAHDALMKERALCNSYKIARDALENDVAQMRSRLKRLDKIIENQREQIRNIENARRKEKQQDREPSV